MRSLQVLTIVGARLPFVKAAMASGAIVNHNCEHPDSQIVEEIVHAGQHYRDNMTEVFLRKMKIPAFVSRLDCGGKSRGAMIGQMLEAVEKEVLKRKPHRGLVYGDVNSIPAGALAAVKLHVLVDIRLS
jgi:UDP-N-acetylglucosamine 2-epimerase (non-hydrolysing)